MKTRHHVARHLTEWSKANGIIANSTGFGTCRYGDYVSVIEFYFHHRRIRLDVEISDFYCLISTLSWFHYNLIEQKRYEISDPNSIEDVQNEILRLRVDESGSHDHDLPIY